MLPTSPGLKDAVNAYVYKPINTQYTATMPISTQYINPSIKLTLDNEYLTHWHLNSTAGDQIQQRISFKERDKILKKNRPLVILYARYLYVCYHYHSKEVNSIMFI